jgi:hypothetical protein
MIMYEVTAIVEARVAEAYERYLRQEHIPDVLGSGCFRSADLSSAAPGRYRMRYEASTDEDLERYLATHAPGLREHAASRFPEGVALSREVWTVIQEWGAAVRMVRLRPEFAAQYPGLDAGAWYPAASVIAYFRAWLVRHPDRSQGLGPLRGLETAHFEFRGGVPRGAPWLAGELSAERRQLSR